MKVCGQKLVKFCAHTHTRGSISSKDVQRRSTIFRMPISISQRRPGDDNMLSEEELLTSQSLEQLT